MDVTLTVEEYGFMVFPEVFDGPPWAEHPKDANEEPQEPRGHVAEIVVDGSATLGAVLNQAAAVFGIALSKQTLEYRPGATVADRIDGVALYLAEDEGTWISKMRFVRRLPAIDETGRLWIRDYREATVEGLQRAAAAGLIEGDVLHPYLRPMVSAGAMGGAAGEWVSVVEALKFLWRLLDALGPLGALPTLVWLGQPLLKRLRRAAKTVEQKSAPLADRGLRPGELAVLLSRRRWMLSEAATLLGTSEQDAAEFLSVLGFEVGDEGTWQVTSDLAGALVKTSVEVVTHAEVAYAPQVEARIRYIVEFVQETGHPPSLDNVFDDSVWSWEDARDAKG